MDLFDIVAARAGGSGGGGAPQVQSDWEQNDSSKKDYIKNRTHWKKEVIINDTTLPYEEPDPDLGVVFYGRKLGLEIGKTYAVDGYLADGSFGGTLDVTVETWESASAFGLENVPCVSNEYADIVDGVEFDPTTGNAIYGDNCGYAFKTETFSKFIIRDLPYTETETHKLSKEYLPDELNQKLEVLTTDVSTFRHDNITWLDVQPTIEGELSSEFEDYRTRYMWYIVRNVSGNTFYLSPTNSSADNISQAFTMSGFQLGEADEVVLEITSSTEWRMGILGKFLPSSAILKPEDKNVLEITFDCVVGYDSGNPTSAGSTQHALIMMFFHSTGNSNDLLYNQTQQLNGDATGVFIGKPTLPAIGVFSTTQDYRVMRWKLQGNLKITYTDTKIYYEGNIINLPLQQSTSDVEAKLPLSYPIQGVIELLSSYSGEENIKELAKIIYYYINDIDGGTITFKWREN